MKTGNKVKNCIKKYITIAILLTLILTSCGQNTSKNVEIQEPPKNQETNSLLPENPEDIAVKQDMPENGVLRFDVGSNSINGFLFIPNEVTKATDLFEYKYPGWEVQIVEGTKSDETLPSEDSPDILLVSGEDKNRMYTGNHLEDLTTWFAYDAEDLDMTNILPGILDITRTGEGAVYTLPTSFSVDAIHTVYPLELSLEQTPLKGEIPEPWTWDAFVQFTQPEMVRLGLNYLIKEKPQNLALILFFHYHSYIYDDSENAYNFDSPVFKEIIQSIKMMCDQGLLPAADDPEEIDQNLYIGEITEDTPPPIALFDIYTVDNHVIDYKRIKYPEDYSMFRTVVLPLPIINGTEGKAALTTFEYAINAHAQPEVKTAAWEFMKIMISEEVQRIKGLISQPIMAELDRDTVEFILGDYLISDEEIDRYNNERIQYFSDVNRLYGFNDAPDIREILMAQLIPFFTDEISYDQMVESLQAEVDAFIGQ